VSLSDSGNVMAFGMADSTVRVFIFEPAKLEMVQTKDLFTEEIQQMEEGGKKLKGNLFKVNKGVN